MATSLKSISATPTEFNQYLRIRKYTAINYLGDKNNNNKVNHQEVTWKENKKELQADDWQKLEIDYQRFRLKLTSISDEFYTRELNDGKKTLIDDFEYLSGKYGDSKVASNGRLWVPKGIKIEIEKGTLNSALRIFGKVDKKKATVITAPGLDNINGLAINSRNYNSFTIKFNIKKYSDKRSRINLYAHKNYAGEKKEYLVASYWLPINMRPGKRTLNWALPYSQDGHKITKLEWVTEGPTKNTIDFTIDDLQFVYKKEYVLPTGFPESFEEMESFNGGFLKKVDDLGFKTYETINRYWYNNTQFFRAPTPGNGKLIVTTKSWNSFGFHGSNTIKVRPKDQYLYFSLRGALTNTKMLKVEINHIEHWLHKEAWLNTIHTDLHLNSERVICAPYVRLPLSNFKVTVKNPIVKFQIIGNGTGDLLELDHIGTAPE